MNFFRKKAAHLCILNSNAGDNALNLVIQKRLKKTFRVRHVEIKNRVFGPEELREINGVRLIILGGGGLIHSYAPDGTPYPLTGTLWQIRLEDLKALRPKIVLYGVGFNQFYGEERPAPAVGEFFRILISKNALVSFRNDGSRERFTEYFPEFEKYIHVIPDPGLFFRPAPVFPSGAAEPYAALQIAADRANLRYNGRFEELLKFIRGIRRRVKYRFILIPHTVDDAALCAELGEKLDMAVSPFKNRVEDTSGVVGYYALAAFAVSARGHGQIFSVGNRVPVFSIVTHPKIEGFARACGLEEYSFYPRHEPAEKGLERFEIFLSRLGEIAGHLERLNEEFDRQAGEFDTGIDLISRGMV